MKRAVLLTGHFPTQLRKPSMLWISEHLQTMGWHVTHVTVGYSWLSHLRRDPRLRTLPHRPKPGTERLSASLTALYGLPPLHPIKTRSRALNSLSEALTPLFTHYWAKRLRPYLRQADLVIAESGAPALLAPLLAHEAPHAPRIYRVNDDIRLLNAPNVLIRAEAQNAALFTRISTASPHLAALFSQHPNVTLDPMGIPHAEIKVANSDLFPSSQPLAVCAGTTQLDIPALIRIADHNPHWQIHVLGRLRHTPPHHPNITWHGEQSYRTTLDHIASADIGLAPYCDAPGVEYQATNSNRILLYRHFGLPILGPDRLCHNHIPSLISHSDPVYQFRCETYRRQPEPIPDWSELALRLTQNGETEPPKDVTTSPFSTVNPRVKTVPALASNA